MPDARVATALESIAANLRKWRARRSLTQEALAEAADLDLRFLQRVERGGTNLSVASLVALANALQVRPSELFRPGKLPAVRIGRPRQRRQQASAR